MKTEIAKEVPTVTFDIPDIGCGRMITTSTQILMCLLLEQTKYEKLRVLESVINHLGISPKDFDVLERNDAKHSKLDYDHDEPFSFE
jgi:hypothetical protein